MEFCWFLNHKINALSWYNEPNEFGNLTQATVLATAAADQKPNSIYLWRFDVPRGNRAIYDPIQLSSIQSKGAVTQLQWLDVSGIPYLLGTTNQGNLSIYRTTGVHEMLNNSVNRMEQEEGQEEVSEVGIIEEKTIKINKGVSTNICVNKETQQMCICGEDGKITILTMNDIINNNIKNNERSIERGDSSSINDIQYINNNTIITVGSTGYLKLWDTRSLNSIQTMHDVSDNANLRSVTVHSTQSQYVCTGSFNGELVIWDTRINNAPLVRQNHSDSPIWKVKFHDNLTDYLFVCDGEGQVLQYDFNANKDINRGAFTVEQENTKVYSMFNRSTLSINCLDFHQELQSVICGSDEGALLVRTHLQ